VIGSEETQKKGKVNGVSCQETSGVPLGAAAESRESLENHKPKVRERLKSVKDLNILRQGKQRNCRERGVPSAKQKTGRHIS